MAGAALGGLAGHEGGEVALDQRLHHRVLGGERLQQHAAGGLGAAGAAGDLVQQLHRAFRRAQIAAGQAQIGVHHAHQRQMRKVPALGDDLGADDQVHRARLDGVGGGGGGVRAGHACRWPSPGGGRRGTVRRLPR